MQITSNFKMIFLTVVAITVSSILGVAVLAFFGDKATEPKNIPIMQQNLCTLCTFGWQSGIGAILGLIGGKATEPNGNS